MNTVRTRTWWVYRLTCPNCGPTFVTRSRQSNCFVRCRCRYRANQFKLVGHVLAAGPAEAEMKGRDFLWKQKSSQSRLPTSI